MDSEEKITTGKKKYQKPKISIEQLERELYESNQSLWETNQKLQKEEEAQIELLSNLSHDLRSPMSALSSSLECLKTMNPSPEESKIYDLMARRLNSMQTLINDIFLLTKLESNALNLDLQEVAAGAFLENFFYDCLADDRYEERELKLELEGGLTGQLHIDPQQMIRVLDNLFTNALKYSDAGARITLRARAREGLLDIQVEDTGIGIAEDKLEKIFERSYRINKARSNGDGSSGLGLSIAKEIVEKHGGRISCQSSIGKGSCFRVELPYGW